MAIGALHHRAPRGWTSCDENDSMDRSWQCIDLCHLCQSSVTFCHDTVIQCHLYNIYVYIILYIGMNHCDHDYHVRLAKALDLAHRWQLDHVVEALEMKLVKDGRIEGCG